MNPRLFKNKAYYPVSVTVKTQEEASAEECKVSDQMKREFDEWALKEGLPVEWLSDCGFYDARTAEIAWQAWKASRKALVVELPREIELTPVYEDCFFVREVKDAISAAGVTYK